MKNRPLHILLVICSIAFFSNSYALSTDRDQPADISSDEVDVDIKTGRRTFIGNVRFIQGTLRIKGDRLDATIKDGKLLKAVVRGKLAAFKQRPDGKENDVEGYGQTIIMDKQDNILTLKKEASLKQGFDTAKGNVIIYNMENDTLKVKGATSVSQNNKKTGDSKQDTKTDPFFTEKKPDPTEKTSNQDTKKAPVENIQTAPNTELTPETNDKPEKLILPGQSSGKKRSGRDSSNRSRLIIKPKSKSE